MEEGLRRWSLVYEAWGLFYDNQYSKDREEGGLQNPSDKYWLNKYSSVNSSLKRSRLNSALSYMCKSGGRTTKANVELLLILRENRMDFCGAFQHIFTSYLHQLLYERASEHMHMASSARGRIAQNLGAHGCTSLRIWCWLRDFHLSLKNPNAIQWLALEICTQ